MYSQILIVFALIVFASGAPTTPSTSDCENGSEEYDIIEDQRQNGTENYRLNVNGVVLMVAPSNSLLAAATLLDIAELGTTFQEIDFIQKSEEKPSEEKEVESESNIDTTKRKKLLVPSLVAPFLKKRL